MAKDGGKRMGSSWTRGTHSQKRPTFTTRTATDDAAQLGRRFSMSSPAHEQPLKQSQNGLDLAQLSPMDPDENPESVQREQGSRTHTLGGWISSVFGYLLPGGALENGERKAGGTRNEGELGEGNGPSDTTPLLADKDRTKANIPRAGHKFRPPRQEEKLGTFSGVFVPTTLNILSILMFIRFGFILGQGGFLGTMALLIASYIINLITTLSISAIASNGTVRGGGAYYLISRSLGAEFGGSIGTVFYLGFVFNTGLNAVGLVDVLFHSFGTQSGNWANFLPEGLWWRYLWSTVILVLCTIICLAGSSIFAKCSSALLAILLISTLSIPLSAIYLPAQVKNGIEFTGLSLTTLKENLLPHFTRHAAGSQLRGRENWADLFGILFPATGGIFAGASMSSDLRNPSKAIPKGTLYGLGVTFFVYTVVILSMAASITRASLYRNVNVIQETAISEVLIFLGEVATSFFSVLMGVIGPAKLAQAIARDSILPGLSIFRQGTKRSDEPTYAIFLTLAMAQVTILFDLNRLASFITMTYLMTFLVMNLACCLLRASSAPNFRPSFRWFNRWTALLGTLVSGLSMFFVDGFYAVGCLGVLLVLFALIHYTTPPKSWGDISQALAYHQVRKYLLRLRQEHVKFWRPQILLFVNNPRRSFKLIKFCNSLKKGSLFVIGHCIVAEDFDGALTETRRQQTAWKRLIDHFKIKAFVNIIISPGVTWGMRNLVLNAGLGGMRPNVVILGFYNLAQYRANRSLSGPESHPDTWELDAIFQDRPSDGLKKRHEQPVNQDKKPAESYRSEGLQNIQSFLAVLEDLMLKVHINVAVARGFSNLEIPDSLEQQNSKRYIDLWPIQMSAEIARDDNQRILTTNFDTYTLILNLGAILNTVPSYKRAYRLRVIVFVEYEMDVEEERRRVITLLENIRIKAQVVVLWLASGEVKSYQHIVNGADENADTSGRIDSILRDDTWWKRLKRFRKDGGDPESFAPEGTASEVAQSTNLSSWSASLVQQGRTNGEAIGAPEMNQLVNDAKGARKHRSMNSLNTMGVSLGMRTHHLLDNILALHNDSTSEESDSTMSDDEDFDYGGAAEDWTGAFQTEEDQTLVNPSSAGRSETPSSPARRSQRSRRERKHVQRSSKSTTTTNSNVASPTLQASGSNSELFHARMAQKIQDENLGDLEQLPDPTSIEAAGSSNTDDGPNLSGPPDASEGPSIAFAETTVPPRKSTGSTDEPHHSIYSKEPPVPSGPASGYPSAAATPLSFNDLPCRAQHLILNDLMLQHSKDTAVIFTTLPAPLDGTHKSAEDSLSYLTDLEVLTDALPPTLLVYSNSMTVTTNL